MQLTDGEKNELKENLLFLVKSACRSASADKRPEELVILPDVVNILLNWF